MPNFWGRSAATLGLIALVALGAGALAGATAGLLLFSAGLLLYLFFHVSNLRALDLWLQRPDVETVPHGSGMWEEIFSALYQLMRRQSRSRHQLSSVLARFQLAANAIPDGIIMLNEADQIEWCNPVAERQLGLDNERDRGQRIHYLLRQGQFSDYLGAHNYSEPLILKPARSQDITLSLLLVPFGDKQKLLISRDITDLERVETMRRDFVANVSHELRTPLTVVAGFLETLTDLGRAEDDQLRHYFALMLEQTLRMQRLVEDLLTLSRLESTQNALQEAPVDIPALLETLFQEAQSLSAGRHRLRLEMVSHLGLFGSREELRSAFGNLVSNAIRYTPAGGGITLRWEVAEERAVFSVRDTGEGIEAQHLPRLTERFYRVDRSRSRQTGGTGLGLSIVKHVLTRHQGRLEIASEFGKGSTFSACFPLQRVLPQEEAAVSPSEP